MQSLTTSKKQLYEALRGLLIQHLVLILAAGMNVPGFAKASDDERIDYSRDIRPILAGHCLHCHGPDAGTRKAQLRLDDSESALVARDGYRVIHPGKPDDSLLLSRVLSEDPDVKMPPSDSDQRRLSAEQIDLLRRWIQQGANWGEHWSFVAPKRASLSVVDNHSWSRNSIDFFILDRLNREGLGPSPPADPIVLLRRVTLALTGLPPTIQEDEAFLSDNSRDAYEKVVARLLDSPNYGEHMALKWLDAARYADTSGYQADWERFMWPWRDWVV
ncbi:MAG TPA: DUF1549 domain-containing protein, partial [Pirellula sp.]|nr:DUF1549 domain-containing protein [Pirellula sp.]